jgi:hypothetical protein
MATAPLSRPAAAARPLRAGLIIFGVSQLALGLWMVFDPSSFFDYVGGFGTQNDHYIRDVSTWQIAMGVVALIAAQRPRWRVPVLAFAVIQFTLHTINHVVDADEARLSTSGWGDVASLAVGIVLLAGLLRWSAEER